MPNPENLVPFKPGEDERRNPGKAPGTKNRSTIARKVLEMRAMFPKEKMEALKLIYPEITEQSTVEEMMTIVMANQAIVKGDTNAYKALQDSAYGAPKQEIDSKHTGSVNIINLGSGTPPNEAPTETE